MRLRIEEQLGVHHVVGLGAAQVRHRHVEEVLFVQQHAGAGVVDVEKALQVAEGVRRAQRLDIGIGELHLIAPRQIEDQLGFERALDVDVQFGLGHRLHQAEQAIPRDRFEVDRGGRIEHAHLTVIQRHSSQLSAR